MFVSGRKIKLSNFSLNPELDSELNFEPQTLGYHHSNNSNDGLLADFDPLLSPTSINSIRLGSSDADAAGDLAGSSGHSPACNNQYNASLDMPTTNMAAIIASDTNESAQLNGDSSGVIEDSTRAGVLQQVMTPELPSSRDRVRRQPLYLNRAADCFCDLCDPQWKKIGLGYRYGNRAMNLAHSSIELCENIECDSRYGVRRVPDTEHLFDAQFCHGRNVSCCCAAPDCNFVSERWSDLRRHHVTKHCIKPKLYPCSEPFCVYGGKNGFKRLDKLKDHHRKVHEGKLRPVQAQRPIQSAATKPATM